MCSAHRPWLRISRVDAGQRHLVVDDGDGRPAGAADEGVVPGAGPVRVQAEADPAADRAVGGGEVEVPRLAPQLLGAGLVPALVGRIDGGALGHVGYCG